MRSVVVLINWGPLVQERVPTRIEWIHWWRGSRRPEEGSRIGLLHETICSRAKKKDPLRERSELTLIAIEKGDALQNSGQIFVLFWL